MNESDDYKDRAAADVFLQAVLVAPSVWTKFRYSSFRFYTSAIEECPTEKDIQILKSKFLENEEEPALYRADAAFVLAKAQVFQVRELHEAVDYLRLGLDFINESPPQDDDRVVFFPPFDQDDIARHKVTVKGQLEYLKLLLEKNLEHFQNGGGAVTGDGINELSEQVAEKHGFAVQYDVLCSPASDYERKVLVPRVTAGGFHCDCCKKTTQELGMEELLKCGRCMMVFYCSSQCQRMAWRAGHKHHCRKKGEIQVGDDMVLQGTSRKDLNGCFVKVVGKGTVAGKWIVKLCNSEHPLSVSGDKLHRIRPEA